MLESAAEHLPSLLLYISVFGVSAALIYAGHKYGAQKHGARTALTTLGLAVPALLAGIRYYVGHDYSNYAGMVERVQAGETMWPRAVEPLSSLIINISALLGGSVVMFTLFSAFTIFFAYLALRKMSPPGAIYITLAWFAYLCIQFPTTLNAVRSGVSVSIMAYAFSQLIDRSAKYRLIKFFVLIGSASLFHASALIFLPIGVAVYLISRDYGASVKSGRILFGLAALCALILPVFGNIVAAIPLELISNYARYFEEAGSSFYIPIVSLAMLLVLSLTYLINRTGTGTDPKLRTLYSIAIYYIPVAIAVGWLSYYTGTSRLTFYFDIIIIALMAHAVRQFAIKKSSGKKPTIVVVLIVLMFSSALLLRNLNWAGALPYNTVFSQEATNARKN